MVMALTAPGDGRKPRQVDGRLPRLPGTSCHQACCAPPTILLNCLSLITWPLGASRGLSGPENRHRDRGAELPLPAGDN